MADKTPIEHKAFAEACAAESRKFAAYLRDRRNAFVMPKLALAREVYGHLDAMKIPHLIECAMREAAIASLEQSAMQFDREANRLRFEVMRWSDDLRAQMQAEIAEFNKGRL